MNSDKNCEKSMKEHGNGKIYKFIVAKRPDWSYGKQTIERVSIECRKTKTKVITLANQKGRRQSSKPIKTQSNYT